MLLSRLIVWQLRVFVVISTVALALTFISYAHVPSMIGIGVDDVEVDFADASGLYPKAQVTYRGVKVGQVSSLEISKDGAVATLRIDDDAHVPVSARAELHSTSAIGEQYVDLVARTGEGPFLTGGSRIGRARAIEMPQITPALEAVNRLLASVPRPETRSLLDEVSDGLGGGSADLRGLVDASDRLVSAARANIATTTSLVDNLHPVLATQVDLAGSTRRYAGALRDLTGTIAAEDAADVRALLRSAPGGLGALTRTVTGLRPTLPMLLANATTTGSVLNAYLPGLRQLMVVYPATIARLQGVANPRARFGDAHFDLRATFNDPPACRSGYLPPDRRRSPSQTTTRDVDRLAHCAIPAADPIAVRGAHNLPCPHSSARGPLPADCGLTFPRGVWPGPDGTAAVERGDAADDRQGNDPDSWTILVLAPLEVR